MANCVISFDVDSIASQPMAYAKLGFRPVANQALRGQDGSLIWPDSVTLVLDAAGQGTITLKTGLYTVSVATRQGEVYRPFPVPDRVTATAAEILATPDVAYEVITWVAFQGLVDATVAPYASVAAGLAAVTDGTAFLAASDDTIAAVRRVAGAPVFLYPELM